MVQHCMGLNVQRAVIPDHEIDLEEQDEKIKCSTFGHWAGSKWAKIVDIADGDSNADKFEHSKYDQNSQYPHGQAMCFAASFCHKDLNSDENSEIDEEFKPSKLGFHNLVRDASLNNIETKRKIHGVDGLDSYRKRKRTKQ